MTNTDASYVTEESLEAMKDELLRLKGEARRDIAKRLRRAKELGDLSENAEYSDAREEQQRIERRIVELERLTQNAKVIERRHRDVIEVGSKIKVKKNGDEFIFTLVGPNEADPANGLLSYQSPIGRSLIGKNVGDQVAITTPSGNVVYEILSIN